MPDVILATPQISVRLYKSIMRKVGDAGLPTSERYANKEAFIDLTPFLGDGSAVTTSKSLAQPCGSFTLTFSDRPNISGQSMGPVLSTAGLESVYGLVEPMDIVEIRMWGGIGARPDPLPIKMRGMVTNISRSRQMTPDGHPIRTVQVTGQDYGKILQSFQILYIPSYDGSAPLLTGFNFFEQFGGAVQNCVTGAEFIGLLLDHAINPTLEALIPENNGMPRKIIPDIQTSGMVSDSWMRQEGSVYDLFKSYLDVGIWNELFIEDREDGVYLVWRPVPYFDMTTNRPTQQLARGAVFATVPDNMVISYQQTRDDTEVYNYYWCTNQRFDMVDDGYRRQEALISGGQQATMDYPNTAKKYYGIRAMYAESVTYPESVQNVSSGLNESEQTARGGEIDKWIHARRQVMIDNNKDNVVLEKGSLQLKGGIARPGTTDALKSGDYVRVEDGLIAWNGYVLTLTDTFAPYRSYVASIEFTRGTGFAERVSKSGGGDSPWLREQATRGNVAAFATRDAVKPDPRLEQAFAWLEEPTPSIGWKGIGK